MPGETHRRRDGLDRVDRLHITRLLRTMFLTRWRQPTPHVRRPEYCAAYIRSRNSRDFFSDLLNEKTLPQFIPPPPPSSASFGTANPPAHRLHPEAGTKDPRRRSPLRRRCAARSRLPKAEAGDRPQHLHGSCGEHPARLRGVRRCARVCVLCPALCRLRARFRFDPKKKKAKACRG